MKKLFLVFLTAGLVLGVYAGLSYWVGMQAEQQYNLLLTQISRADYLDASKKVYERGIFRSKAETKVVMKQPEHGELLEFGIVHSIHHGPLAFVSNPHLKGTIQPVLALIWTHLSPGAENSEQLRKILDTIPELGASEFLTVLSLDGSGASYLDVPPFTKKFAGQQEGVTDVEWGGFSFRADFEVYLDEMSGTFSAPLLEIAENEERFRIRELKGEFNSHQGIRAVNVGSASVSVGSIELIDKRSGSIPFLLQAPGFHAAAVVAGETINSSLRIEFERVTAANEAFGPFIFEFEARKLDPDALSRIPQLATDISGKLQGSSDIKGVLSQFYSGLLIDLLARSPEFELKRLEIRTGKGDLTGKAKLAFAGSGPAGNIFALLQSVSASVDLSISEALFFFVAERAMRAEAAPGASNPGDPEKSDALARQNARELSDLLLSQNLMVREDGSLKSSAAYKQGRLTLNGRKIQAADLFKLAQ
ncbi:MAG: YdgA family protein [Syntrophobacteraceae bacterium]